jgi:hypothetical protein
MVKVTCRMSARRSTSRYPFSKPRSRSAGSPETSSRHIEKLDGDKDDDDLVTAILRAIDIAKSCRSGTTVKLLKIALLNEGIRLAANLSRQEAALATRVEDWSDERKRTESCKKAATCR